MPTAHQSVAGVDSELIHGLVGLPTFNPSLPILFTQHPFMAQRLCETVRSVKGTNLLRKTFSSEF